jgi:hypothetical protein
MTRIDVVVFTAYDGIIDAMCPETASAERAVLAL